MRWKQKARARVARSPASRAARFLASSACWVACATGALAGQDSFFDTLRERARAAAEHDYVARSADDLPQWLAKLDFDGYRRLRFRPEMSLWSGDALPFHAQFMHRGYLFRHEIKISVLDGSEERELAFSPAQYDYSAFDSPPVPDALGYSGFAICGVADGGGHCAEIASFQGASYFRFLVPGQTYGTSLRGLAIDTAAAKGEEFPEFVEFWIEKPASTASTLTIYAMLDSMSATGAYRFLLAPHSPATLDVSASLHVRKPVEKLGLAPLTSMFLFDERGSKGADWRPEVHDSDGLLIASSDGTWTWRRLSNPPRTHRVTRFALENPLGFGLLQRDRTFASYEDLEAHFENRPSYWVTPRGSWGKGNVELVEIPTPAEWNDNVVAYWVPEAAPTKGQELLVEYTISAFADQGDRPPLARLASARTRPGKDAHLFVLDFTGAALEDPDEPLAADVAPSRGSVRNLVLQRNEPAASWRLSFELVDESTDPMDVRVVLKRADKAVSETVVLPWASP